MDALNPFTVFLIGVVVRVGIPLGATALLIWLLRRLDARWEAEARAASQRIPAPAPAPAAPPPEGDLRRVPCWEVNDCSAEQHTICPIYGRSDVLCWQYFRDKQGHLREACLGCQVFRNTPTLVPA